jgi:hypothetical protein
MQAERFYSFNLLAIGVPAFGLPLARYQQGARKERMHGFMHGNAPD